MIGLIGRKRKVAATTLGRLRSDVRGNTLAMMAIALIPLCGIIGSGIDTARLYVVKVRLQQACDAGVLAGRKSLVSSTAPLDVTPSGQAQTFFKNNFKSGWMRTTTATFTPVKTSDNQVNGTATTNVPMTIMKMFGMPDVALTVTCQARYDVADTDIMFVLDTTGSMASKPDGSGAGTRAPYTRENGTQGYANGEASGSKIGAIRAAVLNFYDTVAASADSTTHIRYGFVPYSLTVNVGQAIFSLDPSYLADSAPYNSRQPAGEPADTVYSTNAGNPPKTTNTAQTACAVGVVRTPATGYTVAGSGTAATATAIRKTTTWTNSNGGTCTTVTDNMKVSWTYQNKSIDTSQLKTFAPTTDPTRFGGGTITWNGCIEEGGKDGYGLTSFNQSALPSDLDPDFIPTAGKEWRLSLPEVSYWRGNNTAWTSSGPTSASANSDFPVQPGYWNPGYWVAGGYNSDYVVCPKAAKRLSAMTRSDVANYVSASGDFRAAGFTYHDSGMIWGTRLIAPNGPFKADTAAWPNRNDPNRYIVFMTDGDMVNTWNAYHLYGIEYYDKRISGTDNDMTYHNARFLAECAAAKARGITVFVVAFGQTLTTPLKTCASPGQSFQANDSTALETAFQNIAKQVALLRVSQ
ncbi:MAG: TadE/TadG family type IV pilus assembly protein [Pseudomonadota bacterium]